MNNFERRRCNTIVLVTLIFVIFVTSFHRDRIRHRYVTNFFHKSKGDDKDNSKPDDYKNPQLDKTKNNNSQSKMKYILLWTSNEEQPWVYSSMGVGQERFIQYNCPYTNCYVTSDKTFFKDYAEFDVVAFAETQVASYNLPERRSPHQKYVLVGMESAANYPICDKRFDGFFNWTWTYQLDSDSRRLYMAIWDMKQNIVGPNKIMHWLKPSEMFPVSENVKEVLRKKNKAAAWFVSNCRDKSNRGDYATALKNKLRSQYNLDLDIYGECGNFICDRKSLDCDEIIRRDYFFYLAFENSFSEDYVTEKLLRALEYNAIPIVYGGANYSRFLPDVSYLNARVLGVDNLAAKMHELINDFDKYVKYFKWTNHYMYRPTTASVDSNEYCAMCALLNNDTKVKQHSVYKEFRKWWNGKDVDCGH